MQKLIRLGILTGMIFFYPVSLYAYVGPGMGGGVLAAFFGIVGAILLAIFGVIYYPIKRAIKKSRDKKKSS